MYIFIGHYSNTLYRIRNNENILFLVVQTPAAAGVHRTGTELRVHTKTPLHIHIWICTLYLQYSITSYTSVGGTVYITLLLFHRELLGKKGKKERKKRYSSIHISRTICRLQKRIGVSKERPLLFHNK